METAHDVTDGAPFHRTCVRAAHRPNGDGLFLSVQDTFSRHRGEALMDRPVIPRHLIKMRLIDGRIVWIGRRYIRRVESETEMTATVELDTGEVMNVDAKARTIAARIDASR